MRASRNITKTNGKPKAILAAMLLGLLLASLPGAAQPPADRLTAWDVFNLHYVSDPQISPDGRRVIYVRQWADVMTDRRCSNLWIINFDGTEHRALTSGKQSDTSPRWSPDGTRLAYVSDRDGTPQLYVRWLDTGQETRLTNLTTPPSGLAWSPDGKLLSFSTLVLAAPTVIAPVPPAPEGAQWAPPPRVVDNLIYRFNALGYLKPGYMHVFVVPADGGTPRQITSGNFHHGGGAPFRSGEAVWTPDSRYLLLSANRRPDFDMEPLDSEIWEFAVADGTARALTNRRGPDTEPAVSPDGRLVAYTGFDDRYQGYQVRRLYLMNRNGSNSRLLSGDFDRDVRQLAWAADGSGIYFLYDDQGNTKLGFTTLDGRRRKLADNIGTGAFAAFYSVARNGNFAFTYTRPDVPGDLAVGTAAAPGARVITSVNAGLLAQKKLGQVEEVWYESSLDRRKVHGWIIKPPGFDPAKKYPLILEIHGGPFANYGDRFDFEKQVMAGRGYVVLYTNPRGSTSYGEEFGNLIHHAYPGDDFYDLNSGVDAALATGYVDPEQLFVTGGSGGGVLTCWMIGRTDRFRAAVTVYPVINWYSFVLTSDIPAFVIKYWFPGFPWEQPEHYMKRSLLSLVGNVKTPTMVLTGEEDWRTPMSESEQYYTALKLRGIDTVLVRVPDEAHGISRHPSHHMTKLLNIVGWFDKHRKKP